VVFEFTYRGEDCVKKFLEVIYKVSLNILIILTKIAPMKPLTSKQEELYKNTNICHICKEEITEFEIKVHDHGHGDGMFRGAAHLICNLNYKEPLDIPVIIHNLKNFDSNLILSNR
jgi:hypothetical protein